MSADTDRRDKESERSKRKQRPSHREETRRVRETGAAGSASSHAHPPTPPPPPTPPRSQSRHRAQPTAAPDDEDLYGEGRMPNPTPLDFETLHGGGRSGGSAQRMTPEERAQDRHAEMMARFGIDPDAVKHAWRTKGMAVPGTYNPLLETEEVPHGAECPYCKYIASLGDGETVRNYINDMNGIVQLCMQNSDNFEATARALASYWQTNVYEPRAAAGVHCPQFTVEEARKHLQIMTFDGISDARQTARSIRMLELAALSCVVRVNPLTDERTLDAKVADVLLRIPAAKKCLHETQWTKSQFRIPSGVRPEDVAAVAPLLQLYSTRQNANT